MNKFLKKKVYGRICKMIELEKLYIEIRVCLGGFISDVY